MKGRRMLSTAAILGCLVGSVAKPAAPAGDKAAAPENIVEAVIKDASERVQMVLATNPGGKNTAALVRTNALVVALAANAGSRSERLALARDVALQLADAAKGQKLDTGTARRQAAVLAAFPDIRAAVVRTPRPPLKEQFDLGEVMNIFAKVGKGGHAIEQELLTMGQRKGPFPPNQLSERVVADAYKTAWVADLSREHEDAAKGKLKPWQDLCDDMRAAALDLAVAARAQQPGPAKAAVTRLNTSCTRCHEQFR